MANELIENVARGAAGRLTGIVNPAELAVQQDARGGKLVQNMAMGGAALGAGASAVVALLNYLKSLQEENELNDDSRLNDDTLYISSPKDQTKAAAEVNRWLAPGLALTGGILSAGGAYALTQAVYNYLQKKQKQQLLDEAQGEALRAADLEVTKTAADAAPAASGKMNLYDLIASIPVALPLLSALAAGGVTFATLHKAFPTIKHPKSRFPKRVRQVAADGRMSAVDTDPEDEVMKSASVMRAEDDCVAAAQEFLLLTVDQMGAEKSASICFTSELLHKAARDGIGGLVQTQRDGGLPALLEYISGADIEPVPLPNRVLAAATICKSARLRPVAVALAAAEFSELAPALSAEILSHTEDQLEKFAGIATLLQLAYFRPQMLEKEAMSSQLAAELEELMAADPSALADAPEGEGTDPSMLHGQDMSSDGRGDPAISRDTLEALTSDAPGGMSEEAEGGDIPMGGEDVQPNSSDPIDEFMEAKKTNSPILEPVSRGDEEAGAHAMSSDIR
jgi:hypothetical protein